MPVPLGEQVQFPKEVFDPSTDEAHFPKGVTIHIAQTTLLLNIPSVNTTVSPGVLADDEVVGLCTVRVDDSSKVAKDGKIMKMRPARLRGIHILWK